jgi:hypothetical protein
MAEWELADPEQRFRTRWKSDIKKDFPVGVVSGFRRRESETFSLMGFYTV